MKKAAIINLPKLQDPRGNLSFIEENKNIPFKIERVYSSLLFNSKNQAIY